MDSGSSDEPPSAVRQVGGSEHAGREPPQQLSRAAPSVDAVRKDHVVTDAIGKALKAHYRALADAPLPDRFLALLAELAAKESADDN